MLLQNQSTERTALETSSELDVFEPHQALMTAAELLDEGKLQQTLLTSRIYKTSLTANLDEYYMLTANLDKYYMLRLLFAETVSENKCCNLGSSFDFSMRLFAIKARVAYSNYCLYTVSSVWIEHL